MRIQKGQSAVEFALMAPIVFMLIFGMIYGGIMFMDYLNFNNHARMIAREVSLATPSDIDTLKEKYNKYQAMLAGAYLVSIDVDYDEEDVTVRVTFERNDKSLPRIIIMFGFPPKEIQPIVYKMKREYTDDT